ncbi:hypothetical protein KSP39_PZI014680 [Platanthera zijinensis]|uniref:Uncharacterized protein n=1 Tax=Platanthera zijinensis TaxID=2320716 RepID=A0AAP0BBN4_9ASPA
MLSQPLDRSPLRRPPPPASHCNSSFLLFLLAWWRRKGKEINGAGGRGRKRGERERDALIIERQERVEAKERAHGNVDPPTHGRPITCSHDSLPLQGPAARL